MEARGWQEGDWGDREGVRMGFSMVLMAVQLCDSIAKPLNCTLWKDDVYGM